MNTDTIVFLGPTLPRDEAQGVLRAEYHPPARMGDLYRLLSERVRRIVIIDGIFHGVPSVWHREILDALSEGIEVIGASSMGALRAAELHPFGMMGRGSIFRWYRDGIIDGDDEVALVHGDEDLGFRPLSTPLVNLRATFAALTRTGAVTPTEAAAVIEWLKGQPFPARSLRALGACPIVQGWPADRAAGVITAAAVLFVDLKRADAIEALRYAAATAPVRPHTTIPGADRSERVMWRVGRSLRGTVPGSEGRLTGQALVAAVEASGLRPQLEAELAQRTFLVSWARMRERACPADTLSAAYDDWRLDQSPYLKDAAHDTAWLDANGLTSATLARLLRDRATSSWLCAEGPAAFGLQPTPKAADAFLADWARAHGVAPPRAAAPPVEAEAGVAQWLVAQGPAYFGLPYFADAAIADELRLSGRAAALGRR